MESSLNNNELKQRRLRGISLIVLVITIIVIVILAVAVILSIANNNPIEQAKKAKFQSDLKTMEEELNMYIASKVSDPDDEIDMEELDVKGDGLKNIIKSATSEWIDKIEVINGKLAFVGDDDTQIEWANEVLSLKAQKGSAENGEIKLTDSLASSIKRLKIYGNTKNIDSENVSVGDVITDEEDENSGRYKVRVKLSGKNLFNYRKSLNESTYVTERELNGKHCISWANNGTYAKTIRFIEGPFKENTTYTISGYMASSKAYSGDLKFVYTDGSDIRMNFGQTLKKINEFEMIILNSYNFKTLDYITGIYTSGRLYIDVDSFQIEEGTKRTEFEPYFEPLNIDIYLDEPIRKVGNAADYIDIVNKKVFRYIEEKNGELVVLSKCKVEDIKEEDITGYDINLHKGTNIVTVETNVIPSKLETVYITK